MGPVAPESVGRISTAIADPTRTNEQMTAAADQTLNTGLKFYEKAQKDQMELTATSAANDYEVKYKTRLAQLKDFEGDPTEAYAQFDADASTWKQDVMSKYANADSNTQNLIRRRMDQVDFRLGDTKSINQALQKSSWVSKTTDGNVSLLKDSAVDLASTFNAKQPDSYLKFDAAMGEIRQRRIEEGRTNGSVSVDPETGNERYSPVLIEKMRKDVGEAVSDTYRTLTFAGKFEEAQHLMDKYGDEMTAAQKTKLLTEHKDQAITNEALKYVSGVSQQYPDDAMAKLNRIPDLQVRNKAIDLFAAQSRHFEQAKSTASKQALDDIGNYIQARAQAGQPILSKEELENDKHFQEISGHFQNPKDYQAAIDMVEAPKHSDEKQKASAYDALINGQLGQMSYPEFRQAMRGLNQADQNKFETEWKKAQGGGSDNQHRYDYSYMGKRLTEEMFAAGLINKNQYGHFEQEDDIKRIKAYDDMMDKMKSFPPGTSIGEKDKWVREYVGAMAKGEAFKGVQGIAPKKFQSSPVASPTPAPGATPAPNPKQVDTRTSIQNLDQNGMLKLMQQYQKIEKVPWSKDVDMAKWVEKQGGFDKVMGK